MRKLETTRPINQSQSVFRGRLWQEAWNESFLPIHLHSVTGWLAGCGGHWFCLKHRWFSTHWLDCFVSAPGHKLTPVVRRNSNRSWQLSDLPQQNLTVLAFTAWYLFVSVSLVHTRMQLYKHSFPHTHLPITHKPTRTASGTAPLVRRQTLCPVQQQQSEVLQCRSQCSGTHSCHWANRARAEEPVFSNPPLHWPQTCYYRDLTEPTGTYHAYMV